MNTTRLLPLVILGLLVSPARAGDPTAHAGAMIKAANIVGLSDEFKNGVGAPLLNGVPQVGKFFIRTDGRDDCPYESSNGFGDGCPYISINGLSINEPDDWACLDDRQPPRMNLANGRVAPVSSVVATALKSIGIHQVAMVCNWNHFDSNSALDFARNRDAKSAHELVMEYAEEIPKRLEAFGAGDGLACDSKTWETYYARIGNALHYTQDQASEHHAEGNLVCGNTTFATRLQLNPLHRFSENRVCMRWLTDTLEEVTRNNSNFTCDDQVVAALDPALPTRRELNTTMLFLATACGLENGVISHSPSGLYGPRAHAATPLPPRAREDDRVRRPAERQPVRDRRVPILRGRAVRAPWRRGLHREGGRGQRAGDRNGRATLGRGLQRAGRPV